MNEDSSNATPTTPVTPKKKSNLGLLVLLGVLAVAIGLSYVDRTARANCGEKYGKIEKALVAEESLESATVQEWMGKEPDRVHDEEGDAYSEEFDFKGVIRKQTIVVTYSRGVTRIVNHISRK